MAVAAPMPEIERPIGCDYALKIFKEHTYLRVDPKWREMSDTYLDCYAYDDRVGALRYLESQMSWGWCEYSPYRCTLQKHAHHHSHTRDCTYLDRLMYIWYCVLHSEKVQEVYQIADAHFSFWHIMRLTHKETGELIYVGYSEFEGCDDVWRITPDDQYWSEIVDLEYTYE